MNAVWIELVLIAQLLVTLLKAPLLVLSVGGEAG
jgi:hypothetical protein